MGVMDKFLNAMKLNNDEDDDFYDDDYEEPVEEKAPKQSIMKEEIGAEEEKPVRKNVPKVTPMRQSKKTGTGMEVCVIKPTSIEDAREITETLLANRTVVLNLEGLDVDIAQRIIAISGNLQKISHYIFIITPAIVDISGDFQEILAGSFDVPPINNGI